MINERLYYIRLSMPNYDIIIINCDAPTEEKEKELKNKFDKDSNECITPCLNTV